MQKEDLHAPTDGRPLLRVCFAFPLQSEFVGGVLGSGIGPPTEQTWVANPGLKGAGRSAGSMSVEVQCALLQYFCDRPPRMQDIDRKPYELDCNVRLRHDGYRLSERGHWVLGETPTAST